jgi:Domain of unknown function (DUF4184)
MPFTISHVVAVLPLTTPRFARWFPASALVIGTMVPDVPLLAPYLGSYAWSHDLLIGPLTYDLVVGMAVFALWTYALRRPLVDLAPSGLRARLGAERRVRGRAWAWAGLAVVIGAYTHVLWDSFTHANRWGVRQLPALSQLWGPLHGFKWLQYGCGILGLVVLGWWLARWWRRTPPHAVLPTRSPVAFRRFALVVVPAIVVGIALLAGIVQWTAGQPFGGLFLITVGRSAWAAAVLLLLASCLFWWSSTTRQRPGWVGASEPERKRR